MKRLLPIAVLLSSLVAVAPPVMAQTASGASCALIESEVKRLLCYDLVFRRAPEAMAPVAEVPTFEEVPIDEATRLAWPQTSTPLPNGKGFIVSISTVSTEPITDSDQVGKLTISCVSGITAVSLWFPGYFMASDASGRTLSASVDGNSQKLVTTGADSIMNINGGDAVMPFVESMMAGNLLTVSASPTSGSAVSATYSLKGLTQAIQPIRRECKW